MCIPKKCLMVLAVALAVIVPQAQARIKLVALPERAQTVVRLDNPQATLIEEERVLTLQEGLNKVDFSWKGVSIDADSIRLTVLDKPEQVTLLNVSYPPNEAALVWEISSAGAWETTVRISYLLYNIDRLITYKAIADTGESTVDLTSYIILRNFSGEDFADAQVLLNYGEAFDRDIKHEETKQLQFFNKSGVPIVKEWVWDSLAQPWDPEQVEGNIGIPVNYVIKNTAENKLGEFALWGGKTRIFQNDGHGSTIFLGEDTSDLVPVGEKMELYIGDSRDIVVTQRQMKEERVNVRRNNANAIVLWDMDIVINAKIENFKDKPAKLTMVEHMPDQWKMVEANMEYKTEDVNTLKFEIDLPARTGQEPAVKNLEIHYQQLNIRQ